MLEQRAWGLAGLSDFQALDQSLKRWAALTRYLADGEVPIDNK